MGDTNSAIGDYSAIGGGSMHAASGNYSVIGGGFRNSASGHSATVSGGNNNDATGINATISGGTLNDASGDESTISGGSANTASGLRTTISGGYNHDATGSYSSVSGGLGNSAINDYATVSGGYGSTASGQYSTVTGGILNIASGHRSVACGSFSRARGDYSVVAGGGGQFAPDSNAIASAAPYGTISGGAHNRIADGWYASVGGGFDNTVSGHYGVISGGLDNAVTGQYGTVPGGGLNRAYQYAFACGYGAQADHAESFVFADGVTTNSFGIRTVTFRCTNGARFYTADGTSTGVQLAGGGGSWSSLSDSTQKENLRMVDTRTILEKVSGLKIGEWNYKSQDDNVRHIGPMAQDFSAAFGLGENNTTITTVDADGVMMAAIQELAKQNQKQQEMIDRLVTEVQTLRARDQQSMVTK